MENPFDLEFGNILEQTGEDVYDFIRCEGINYVELSVRFYYASEFF